MFKGCGHSRKMQRQRLATSFLPTTEEFIQFGRDQFMLYLAIITGLAAVGYGGAQASSVPTRAPSEILVRFRAPSAKISAAAHAEVERLNRLFGLVVEVPVFPVKSLPGNAKTAGGSALERWRLLRFSPGTDADSLALDYSMLKAVERAQPNYLRRFATTPNDSLFRRQWNLSNIGWTEVDTGRRQPPHRCGNRFRSGLPSPRHR